MERQIGKQCKPVQVHSFSRFSPSVQSSQICLLREHPQFPLNGICDTGYSFILNVFLKKKKPGLPFGIQVKIVISLGYSFFSIQPIKILTFSRSSSFMVLSFSHNSRYGVFASSSGAKNSAGVISKYEMILNSSLRDGKAAPLVIPRMYEPLLSKSKAYLLIKEEN